MNSKFTGKATNAINNAIRLASEMGHTYIGSEHLLLALTAESDSVSAKLLERRGIRFDNVKASLGARIGTGERTALTSAEMTPRTKRILEAGAAEAERMRQSYVGTEHILLALIRESGSTAVTVIISLGSSDKEIENDITAFISELMNSGPGTSKGTSNVLADCPMLKKYGRDMTAMAKTGKFDPTVGRDSEIESVIRILSRRTKNNPCLIGEPGVGKTAIVEGLASRINERNVPEPLLGKAIVSLDISSMIAGAKYRGEFEERMKSVMDELAGAPDVILFIDEIHTLVGAGAAEGAVDAANILKPALARGEFKLIGATTTSEYRRHIEKDAAFERRFGPVYVSEPTESRAVEILMGLRDKYESHHKVKITDEAIAAAVTMSVRYLCDRYLPDKALDLIDEAAVSVRIRGYTAPPELKTAEKKLETVKKDKEEAIRSQSFEKAASLRDKEVELIAECEHLREEWCEAREAVVPYVGETDIANIVSRYTGIPVSTLGKDDRERLVGLSAMLKSGVIGQDAAADALSKAILRGRMGLSEPGRPIGSFIFLGPTGVGKTELSRVLAESLFGDRDSLIRIDMSEYGESHSAGKLIGSPPGYVGYGEGGQLTEKIRRKPYSVVLFDEIEKANPAIFNILLQILDEGRLTDSEGRTVSFKNSVIIMTSNIGAEKLTDSRVSLGFAGSNAEDRRSRAMQALRGTFRPEFLNRVDEIIVFDTLDTDDLKKICRLMLESVKKRIKSVGVCIEFTDEAVDFLVEKSYDPDYGARPLKRAIREYIEDGFAEKMLEYGEQDGGAHITVSVNGGEIIFTNSLQNID